MGYSISEVAEMVGMRPSTIRYYEKRGLLPDIDRTESVIRSFSEQDVIVLKLIRSLKKCGLSIEDIGRFSKLFRRRATGTRSSTRFCEVMFKSSTRLSRLCSKCAKSSNSTAGTTSVRRKEATLPSFEKWKRTISPSA
ncbi:MAG TPA: MerR family transcriptional regulator [Candidatus Aveggerthella stercoripullorum]|uniref:MerR family transcriptional regulator n=1 Tax=Candidatus Aveggerthella stercoripullorum TaxID=2840688 RepID=A0A9D1A210_9ACTN|nr:MerR family transcriptional regulator [Candidatus Aveggerthella stercoripullorum]